MGENVIMTTLPNHTSTGPVRILVVDDHPNTAATLARALTQLGSGVQVTSASNGHEALEKVKNSSVDILITDMVMPEMTGLELIEKMQNHPAGRPSYTYLVTAYDVPGLKVTAQRLKVSDVIIKPVRPERMCQIVTQAMDEMKQATHPAKTPKAVARKFKILVADDRVDNVTLLTRYLEYEGYDLVTAQDGVETLEKAHDELPDIILLDVNMPYKDGFTVLKEIRADAALEHIPVIILTAARLDPMDVQFGLNLGADDYVTKPFDRHELMARIRTKLRVKEAEDVIRRRNRELNLLPEIGKELSARANIGEIANVLLKRTAETLGAIHAQMIILDANGNIKENHQVSFSSNDTNGTTVSVEKKLLDHIKETHQGIVIKSTLSDEYWKTQDSEKTRSAVIAPLFGRHELLGLLFLTHEQENYFTLEHLLLLQAIASQAAIAIENTRLYENVSQEQKRLEAILRNAAEAILLFDREGKLIVLNPAAQKLFSDFQVVLGQKLEKGFGYDSLIELCEQAQTSGTAKSGEVTWPDERVFSALLTPIEGNGQLATLHDVTNFKDLEHLKNEFIATASHDLKNPIMSISGYSDLLSKAGPLNTQQQDFIGHIQSSATNMLELVQNMLELVEIDLHAEKKQEPIEISLLAKEVIEEFKIQADEREVTLQMEAHNGPLKVLGNSLQLHQLFRNLIGNAVKYTPDKGSIMVRIKKGGHIEIQDTGMGIPAADLPFIFDRFYRVHSGDRSQIEGNGLGLAIVKSIVENHNGTIRVESEVGKGTCFNISLPALIQ